MLASVEVRKEVIVLRVDILDEIREKSIRIDLPGENILLQLPPVDIVEDAQSEHPLRFVILLADKVSNPSASRLPVT